MKTAILLGLCLLLILQQSTVEAQWNRRQSNSRDVRGGRRTQGSGGPSGTGGAISFPSQDDRRRGGGGGGGGSDRNLHAGKFPGGFYTGSKSS
ncbi:hypothetical protein HNY73_002443 [Argiope bruennichi]|uniref:Uncharacterized protein n=1 Tax=Argiope bruennichi TaxID=94029 RepID=A0A8T0FTI9_ARGBR|nr:hypothetical protein HNY73_002443 [Argiope bruennichi]